VLLRMKYYLSLSLSLLFCCGIFVLSCNEIERHHVLTFFFDGVPPLGQEGLQEKTTGSVLSEIEKTPSESLWYVHEPRKDCTNCHDFSRQQMISTETYLRTPLPQLCYKCHTNYTVSAPYVHGPVAVGQCLQCHTPHKSRIKHLLTEKEPELCYKCHDLYAIELISGHLTKQMSMCTNCHNPHAGSTKALLKVAPDKMGEMFKSTSPTDSSMQNYVIPKEQNGKGILGPAEKTSMLQIFSDVNKLIKEGNLEKARLYLIGFKDSSAFTDQERMKIAKVLELIDEALTESRQDGKETQQESSKAKMYPEGPSSKSQESENQLDEQNKIIAELYYHSMQLYRAGQYAQAREGFTVVLNSGLIPPEMARTIQGYLLDIEKKLPRESASQNSKQ
jgi:predicted CXXCH cytochrome family protein